MTNRLSTNFGGSIDLGRFVFTAWAICSLICCNSTPKPPPKPLTTATLRIVHQSGGTHYRTIIANDIWYQTFGSALLALPPDRIEPIRTFSLGEPGKVGAAIDMMFHESEIGKCLYVILENDELIEISLAVKQSPEITWRLTADELGIRPRRLSKIENELYISGIGGVVRFSDQKMLFTSNEDVSRVAQCDAGLIACVGRRAFLLSDGRYVGSASEVWNTGDANAPIVFARQGEKNVLVGLMTDDIREVDAQRATVSVPGQLQSVRLFEKNLWIITDQTVRGYKIDSQSLVDPIHLDILGACDIGQINETQVAIAGTFGRCIYQLPDPAKTNLSAGGERFVQVHREPSRLSLALTDGRHILAGSAEGLWMYLINSRVELTSRQLDAVPPMPATNAIVSGAQASISDDQQSITIKWSEGQDETVISSSSLVFAKPAVIQQSSKKQNKPEPPASIDTSQMILPRLHTVTAVDGDFWIGHDRGITVLKAQPALLNATTSLPQITGHVRMDGPVRYVYPLLIGGGASFVSEFGGFGVVKFVDEPVSGTK